MRIQFTPHLLPIDRGILTTCYSRPHQAITDTELYELYQNFYRDQPFIRLVSTAPSLKQVRGSNFCDIYLTFDERTGNIISMGAIDNLVKGAAGQAVHNMNLRLGLAPDAGLSIVPLQP
jgi:N-acetyl-gamma-glutamyl-phosphate reductase